MEVSIKASGTAAEVSNQVASQVREIREANGDKQGAPAGTDLSASAPLEALKQYIGVQVAKAAKSSDQHVSVEVTLKVAVTAAEAPKADEAEAPKNRRGSRAQA